MIDFSRGMVKYTSRDYPSILKDFIDLVPTLTDLWKPEADADPGVVLGKYLASVADMLGVNLDWLANEIFAPSVSQRKNAEKIFGLIGYELGWYTAARTEVTFKNNSAYPITLDFAFNGNSFGTLNAYTDITGQSRVITYNILPSTNKYGATQSRSRRTVTTDNQNIFTDTDKVVLQPAGDPDGKDRVTRVAIEGELRSYSVSVADIKNNNYIIKLPSQHLDTTAVWVKSRDGSQTGVMLDTQWIQCSSAAEFTEPEPRFTVTYDNYSNAQIQISNYLNQLENYESNWLTIFWIDCSGVIGCVGENVLSNLLLPNNSEVNESGGDISISNLSNTVELPHTYTVTGRSPETAKEAYINSRKYINTFDSLVTLPDFNRFLNREPGVDCGYVIDCQKAVEINMAIYQDTSLTDAQKAKKYITHNDFPIGDANVDWSKYVKMSIGEAEAVSLPFKTNFKQYTAMCFAVHNDFRTSSFGAGKSAPAQISNDTKFIRYKPPVQFIDNVIRDYRPLQTMTVELQFGFLRVFDWYVIGQIYPKKPVDQDVATNIINKVKEALALYFSPANRSIGTMPTVMEVVNVVRNADSRIDYFDAGSLHHDVIKWNNCDIEWFNPVSFCRYRDVNNNNIRIAPTYLISNN